MKRTFILALLGLLCSFAGQAQEAFTRGFEGKNTIFIPKGNMGIGLSGSFSRNGVGDENGYILIPNHVGDLKGGWTSYGLHPYVEYFIKDNLSVGLRFDYTNNIFSLDSARLSLSDDLGLDISGFNYLRQSYLTGAAVRYYVPFMGSRIFGWFVEGRLSGGYVQSKVYTLEDGLKHGTYQDSFRIGFGINPGVCFFVAENFNFEVQVGLVDLSFSKTSQTENQVRTSGTWRFNGSEKIDLLAIQFGAHVYFDTTGKKK